MTRIVVAIYCNVDNCEMRDPTPAIETHWRIDRNGRGISWTVCSKHNAQSRHYDDGIQIENPGKYRHFYLPLIQPIVGNADSLAVEAFADAVARLLRRDPADVLRLTRAGTAAFCPVADAERRRNRRQLRAQAQRARV